MGGSVEEHSAGREGTAGAKFLRQEPVNVPRSARRPVWLEQREQGQRNTSWRETEGSSDGGSRQLWARNEAFTETGNPKGPE